MWSVRLESWLPTGMSFTWGWLYCQMECARLCKAAIILYNMLQSESTLGVDAEELLAEYRPQDVHGFQGLVHLGMTASAEAGDIRTRFKVYFN